MRGKQGWFFDSQRHALASKGIKTAYNKKDKEVDFRNIDDISLDWLKEKVKKVDSKKDLGIFSDIWMDILLSANNGNEKAKKILDYFKNKGIETTSDLFFRYSSYSKVLYENNNKKIVYGTPDDIFAMKEKVGEKGEETIIDIVDFLDKKYPNKELHVGISDKPISITSIGGDSIRVGIPYDTSINSIFPYDSDTVDFWKDMENKEIPSYVLWATSDIFHEFAHTEGIRSEKKADWRSVELTEEYLESRDYFGGEI